MKSVVHAAHAAMIVVVHALQETVRQRAVHVVPWVAMPPRPMAATNRRKPLELIPRKPPLSASAR